MGYRSQVVVYVKHPEAKARLIMAGLDCILLRNPETSTNACNDRYEATEEYILLQWEDVKWYDSYEDVAKVQRFIDDYIALIEEANDASVACFARIGEDGKDIEIQGAGDYYEYVCIDRSFTINV